MLFTTVIETLRMGNEEHFSTDVNPIKLHKLVNSIRKPLLTYLVRMKHISLKAKKNLLK